MDPAVPTVLRGARRVLVFRALPGLGDMLTIVPALRGLRRGLPQARITLVGVETARWVADRYHYVDEFLAFPGYPGLADGDPDLRALPEFLARLQAGRFDLALQCHGTGITSNPIVAIAAAGLTAGFHLPGQLCPDERGYLEWTEHEHEVLRYRRLLTHLGLPNAGAQLEFPVRRADERRAARLLDSDAGKPFAILHAGANHVTRRWPPDRFASIADAIAGCGILPVLTGTARERGLVAEVSRRVSVRHHVLAGRTDLGVLAALLARARVFVTADTGVAHLAAAVGTPGVVIFRSSDPRRWAPLDSSLHRAVGLDEPVVAAYRNGVRDGRCLADGCRRANLDADAVPESNVGPQDVLREVRTILRA